MDQRANLGPVYYHPDQRANLGPVYYHQDQSDNQGPVHHNMDQRANLGPVYYHQDQGGGHQGPVYYHPDQGGGHQGPVYYHQDQADNMGPVYYHQDQADNLGPVYYHQDQADNLGPVYYHPDQGNNLGTGYNYLDQAYNQGKPHNNVSLPFLSSVVNAVSAHRQSAWTNKAQASWKIKKLSPAKTKKKTANFQKRSKNTLVPTPANPQLTKPELIKLIGEKETNLSVLLKRKTELTNQLQHLVCQVTQANHERVVGIGELSNHIKLEWNTGLEIKKLEKELIAQSDRRKKAEACLSRQVEETSKIKISLTQANHDQEKSKCQWEEELSNLLCEQVQAICLKEEMMTVQEDQNKEILHQLEKRSHLLESLKNTKQALEEKKKGREIIQSRSEGL